MHIFCSIDHRYGQVVQDDIHVSLTEDTFAGGGSIAAWLISLCTFGAENGKMGTFPEKRQRERACF